MSSSLNMYPPKKQQEHLVCLVVRGGGGRPEHLLGEETLQLSQLKEKLPKEQSLQLISTSAYQH